MLRERFLFLAADSSTDGRRVSNILWWFLKGDALYKAVVHTVQLERSQSRQLSEITPSRTPSPHLTSQVVVSLSGETSWGAY